MKTKIYLIVLGLALMISVLGQNSAIELTFTAQYQGQYVMLDSIFIENLTQGGDTMLYTPDTVMVLDYIIGINANPALISRNFQVSQNRPNPFVEQTIISIFLPKTDYLRVNVVNILGQKIASYENFLDAGNHSFVFYPGIGKYYILSATANGLTKAIKMLNLDHLSTKSCSLIYQGPIKNSAEYKSHLGIEDFGYSFGDQLRFIGYAKTPYLISGSDIIEDAPISNQTFTFDVLEGIPCPNTPTIIYEGQTYTTVEIGTQCWFKENMNVGIMINGSNSQTNNNQIEKYCYDNDINNCENYGGLYQWDEMMKYTNQLEPPQGICPPIDGWHIPTDAEWCTLTQYIDPSVDCNLVGWSGIDAGYKMKSTTGWFSGGDGSNASGFTALPVGSGSYNGNFYDLSYNTSIWTSTELYSDWAWFWQLEYDIATVIHSSSSKISGRSVRCVQYATNAFIPTVTTAEVTNITSSTAIAGGEVVSDGGATVTARGICWSTIQNPTIDDDHTFDGTGLGSFVSELTGLALNTPYFVRAYANNSLGTAYGNEETFTTCATSFVCGCVFNCEGQNYNTVLSGGFSVRCLKDETAITIPTVTTAAITNINQNTAMGGGEVTDDGGVAVTSRGVCWSTSQNPTIANSHTNDGNGTGSFVSNIIGLTPNTPYYVRAYATNCLGTAYGNEETFTTIYAGFVCGDVVSYEGQDYNTILIGAQCWFKENLNVGAMINGSQNQTNNGTIEKYCYSNNPDSCIIYGGLYQWNEMMQYSATQGIQGICPENWHLPTDDEWSVLIEYLSSHPEYLCNSITSFIAKSLAATTNWNTSSNTCAIGNNLSTNNASGFTALPAGFRSTNGLFYTLGSQSIWWLSTQNDLTISWVRNLYHDHQTVYGGAMNKMNGYSVRCIRYN